MDLMEQEWRAWRAVCITLGDLDVNVGDHNELVGRIREWGELLARLRRENGIEEHYAKGLADAQALIVTGGGKPLSEWSDFAS